MTKKEKHDPLHISSPRHTVAATGKNTNDVKKENKSSQALTLVNNHIDTTMITTLKSPFT